MKRHCTVGVVGVDVGIGGVPALYGAVNASAETLLPCAAHHHTQYSPPVVQVMMNFQNFLKIQTKKAIKLKENDSCVFTCGL